MSDVADVVVDDTDVVELSVVVVEVILVLVGAAVSEVVEDGTAWVATQPQSAPGSDGFTS